MERSAIGRRSDATHAAELAIEVGQVRETNFKSNHAYGKISLREAHTCASDAELAQVLAYACAGVLDKQTMQRALRDIPDLAQGMNGNRLLKALVKMIEHTRQLSWFTINGSSDCHCVLRKVSGSLPRDAYKKVESCMEAHLRNF